MGDKILCPTCRHNQPHTVIIAGNIKTDFECWHKVASFPTATWCPLYERAPGADDA